MIILFGLAGSGKGTQGKALADLFGWRWLSNGEVIRRSHRYDNIINQGKLIPDQDVINMMNAEIRRIRDQGFDVILDGYPRDVVQAQYLMDHFASEIHGAIILEVPKAELYERLAKRGRDDDHSREAIDQRFAVFEQNITPILELLDQHHIPTHHVDGTGTPEEVTARLMKVVQALAPSAKPQSVSQTPIQKSLKTPAQIIPESPIESTLDISDFDNNFIEKEN